MMTIEEFCARHGACNEGREWALGNCADLQQAWDTAPADYLVWAATRRGVLSDKELRLFAVYCVRCVQHLLTDQRSIRVIDVAERYANGLATYQDLAAAGEAAGAAAWAAAARAARAAAREDHARWLRANTKPNFEVCK